MIKVTYEAHQYGTTEAVFTLDEEEEAKYNLLPEEQRDDFLREVCNQHAYYEDDWDRYIDRTDLVRVEVE